MTIAPTKSRHLSQNTRKLVRIALWTSIGVVLAGIERLIPSPIPWVKLGLANGAALIVLYSIGWREALVVNLFRCIIIGLFFGTWASPVFLLSLGGGIVSILVMALSKMLLGKSVGIVGISTLGSFSHMLTQFYLASILLVHHSGILLFTGPSLIAAIASGIVVGIVASMVLNRISGLELTQELN
jgi:uncharacterized membrane protein